MTPPQLLGAWMLMPKLWAFCGCGWWYKYVDSLIVKKFPVALRFTGFPPALP